MQETKVSPRATKAVLASANGIENANHQGFPGSSLGALGYL